MGVPRSRRYAWAQEGGECRGHAGHEWEDLPEIREDDPNPGGAKPPGGPLNHVIEELCLLTSGKLIVTRGEGTSGAHIGNLTLHLIHPFQ